MVSEEITPEKFSVAKRVKSFVHALRGVGIFLRTAHNAWIQFCLLAVFSLWGVYARLSETEWLFVVLTAGLVFVAEACNTAIEIDIDLTSPEFHPYARDTKDVAAGAVLIAALVAVVVGITIFVNHV